MNGTLMIEDEIIVKNEKTKEELSSYIKENGRPGKILDCTAFSIAGISSSTVDGNLSAEFRKSDIDDELEIGCGFSYTIHKVQGATLTENVCIDLNRRPTCYHSKMLCHASVYVALSRVKSVSQLWLLPERSDGGFSYLENLRPNADVSKFVKRMTQKEGNEKYVPEKTLYRCPPPSKKKKLQRKGEYPMSRESETYTRPQLKDRTQDNQWTQPGQFIPDTVINTLGSVLSSPSERYQVLDSSVATTIFKRYATSVGDLPAEIRTRIFLADRTAVPFFFNQHFALCVIVPHENKEGGKLLWFDSLPNHNPRRRTEVLLDVQTVAQNIFHGAHGWEIIQGSTLVQDDGTNDCALFVCRWMIQCATPGLETPPELSRTELAQIVSRESVEAVWAKERRTRNTVEQEMYSGK